MDFLCTFTGLPDIQHLLQYIQDDFQDLLDSSGDKLIVADFWASWCGPCKMIGPQFEVLELSLILPKITRHNSLINY